MGTFASLVSIYHFSWGCMWRVHSHLFMMVPFPQPETASSLPVRAGEKCHQSPPRACDQREARETGDLVVLPKPD